MADVFISYSVADEPFAQFLYRHLTNEGLKVFLASVSLRPGEKWEETILAALKGSNWVLFLGSRSACQSGYAQQELGVALGTEKRIIPIVWDQPPEALPGWMRRFQAINLMGATPERVVQEVSAIAAGRVPAPLGRQLRGTLDRDRRERQNGHSQVNGFTRKIPERSDTPDCLSLHAQTLLLT